MRLVRLVVRSSLLFLLLFGRSIEAQTVFRHQVELIGLVKVKMGLIMDLILDAQMYREDAAKLERADKNVEAIALLQEAIRLTPTTYEDYLALGRLTREVGQLGTARGMFEEALRLDSSGSEPWVQLAYIAHEEHHWREAIDFASAALERHPARLDPLLVLASSQLALDNLDEAEIAVEQALTIAPQSAWSHALLGQLYARRKDFAKSILEFRQAATLARASDEACSYLLQLGDVSVQAGQVSDAVNTYNLVLGKMECEHLMSSIKERLRQLGYP